MVQSLPKDFCAIRVVIKLPDFRTANVQSPFGITVITDLSTASHSENSPFRMLYMLTSWRERVGSDLLIWRSERRYHSQSLHILRLREI